MHDLLDSIVDSAPLWVGTFAVIVAFLFAVQLLGTATNAFSAELEVILRQIVGGEMSALGLAWVGSYLLGNGSVIAALALSLFTANLLTPSQLFLMVAGSRLGAAAIVIFIGALDYVQKQQYSLSDSVRLGLLAFLLTYTIYLPVTLVGSLVVPAISSVFDFGHLLGFNIQLPALSGVIAGALTEEYGAGPIFFLAVVLLFGSLRLFDRVFTHVDTDWLREHYFVHLENRWLSFGLGLLVTGLTTSIAFSLGVIVPLYNRQYLKRSEIVPYILGANIGT